MTHKKAKRYLKVNKRWQAQGIEMRQQLFALLMGLMSLTPHEQSMAAEEDSLNAKAEYSSDGIGLLIFLTPDKTVIDNWVEPGLPTIVTSASYKRGDHVYPLVGYSVVAQAGDERQNLTYNIRIVKPDGGIYADIKQLVVSSGEPLAKGLIYLCRQHIDIGLEENDPLGIYKVQIAVYENALKLLIVCDLSFEVKP